MKATFLMVLDNGFIPYVKEWDIDLCYKVGFAVHDEKVINYF